MAKVNLQHIEAGIRYFLTVGNDQLSPGEKFVFILISRLLEQNGVISKQDVCNYNNAKSSTTYAFLRSLEKKGFLKSTRSNQYFSKSFLTLTEKGLFQKYKMTRYILNSQG